MGNYTIFGGFENLRRGRQARNLTTNVPKILDLKSSSEQIFSKNWRWVPLYCVKKKKNIVFFGPPVETCNFESLNVYNFSSKSLKGSKKWFFKTVSESINQSFNDLKFCSPCSVPCAHNICIILGRYIHQKMLIHRTARYKPQSS